MPLSFVYEICGRIGPEVHRKRKIWSRKGVVQLDKKTMETHILGLQDVETTASDIKKLEIVRGGHGEASRHFGTASQSTEYKSGKAVRGRSANKSAALGMGASQSSGNKSRERLAAVAGSLGSRCSDDVRQSDVSIQRQTNEHESPEEDQVHKLGNGVVHHRHETWLLRGITFCGKCGAWRTSAPTADEELRRLSKGLEPNRGTVWPNETPVLPRRINIDGDS